MECATAREPASFTLVARQNNSLSSTERAFVVGSLFLIILAISAAFAIQGAWPVLPFAGIEMLVIYAAFRYVDRHASDCETLSIQGDRVLIERWEMGRVIRHEFNRFWARVVLEPAGMGRRSALSLRSHGRQVEFGRYLTEEQRHEVARAIKAQLQDR